MEWLQIISDSKSVYYKLINFLNQYGLSGLEQALQSFEDTQQYYFVTHDLLAQKLK